MCRTYVLLGRPEQAFEVAAAALQIFPDVYHLHDILGVSLAAQGKLPEAINVYTQFTEALAAWPVEWQLMPERVLGSTLAWLRFGPAAYAANANANAIDKGKDNADAAADADNGGWPTQTVPLAGEKRRAQDGSSSGSGGDAMGGRREGRCNIDVRPGLTKAQFIEEYVCSDTPPYDESSECATARQHKVAEVACYPLERTLMGCADPPSKGLGAPHQCSRVNKKRSRWGEFVRYRL